MEFPVLYFTMPDGTELRATFNIHGFDFVRIDISEQVNGLLAHRWEIKTHPYSGRARRLVDFCALPAATVKSWAEQEAKAWYEYSKVLKAYKP